MPVTKKVAKSFPSLLTNSGLSVLAAGEQFLQKYKKQLASEMLAADGRMPRRRGPYYIDGDPRQPSSLTVIDTRTVKKRGVV